MTEMKLFIVIPAYNEESRIANVVRDCIREGYDQILVVDDGSDDETALIAEKSGARVLRHLINRGVGAATETGLEAARMLDADVVVTFDADGQHDPRDIKLLVRTLEESNCDLVIGSRFLSRENKIPFLRRIFNTIGNFITFFLSGISLSDTQSGLKAFSKNALEKINITANGYEFSTEIIREAGYHQLSIQEVPVSVRYTEYSLSKGQNFATGIVMVGKLIIRSLMK